MSNTFMLLLPDGQGCHDYEAFISPFPKPTKQEWTKERMLHAGVGRLKLKWTDRQMTKVQGQINLLRTRCH